MSEEQLKAFLEKVKADTSLEEKQKAASDADAVVAIAKAAGFTITTEDLNSHGQNLTSDDELESAAGGTACALRVGTVFIGSCWN
ncbi:Nitrogen fixation protein of unknown function [Synechococcus sp. MIT S9509]|uniref:Nif11-like leader peptide family natural product precursor n=1 Tax=unclassified Synechococcus TaxID=2626047 RepID=UPI0007BC62C7|nr:MULTISPECIES: Nif11-like leader peptide family natural product precursor [unclassified Synechococcus]KZR88128.1 Nitrogen fixation protein of unknown function [Synechococcus sp. MIT S9504]KZR92087.1 Nitrogen fixation protein of unknown function [Synechococcus sp. MIT S9509]